MRTTRILSPARAMVCAVTFAVASLSAYADTNVKYSSGTVKSFEHSMLTVETPIGPVVFTVPGGMTVADSSGAKASTVQMLHSGQKIRVWYTTGKGARPERIELWPQ